MGICWEHELKAPFTLSPKAGWFGENRRRLNNPDQLFEPVIGKIFQGCTSQIPEAVDVDKHLGEIDAALEAADVR